MNPEIVRMAHRELDGPICVGRIRAGLTSNFGANDNWVRMSRDTLQKQLARHPDLSLDFYENLDWIFQSGQYLRDPRDRCFNVVKISDVEPRILFKATIKIIKSNGLILLLSVHRIKPSDYKRLVRRSEK